MEKKYKNVQVGKIDLDTCGAALILDVSRGDRVEVLRGGEATEEDLVNPEILCIEVGGSGRVAEGNFDHHGPGSERLRSVTRQAWVYTPCPECGGRYQDSDLSYFAWGPLMSTACGDGRNKILARMVGYIDILDVDGPQALGRRQVGLYPTLSDVFAGMLLVTRDPVEQLHAGVEMLREVVDHFVDSYGRMPIEKISEWKPFSEAKAKHNRLAREAVDKAQGNITASGLRMASVESRYIGAIGALYGIGVQVAVVLNPDYEGVRKFTVAGNGVRVDAILPELNVREQGWGGPGTGTILGSPRGKDSSFSLEEVAEIVRRNL